jgi:hypothetical protein
MPDIIEIGENTKLLRRVYGGNLDGGDFTSGAFCLNFNQRTQRCEMSVVIDDDRDLEGYLTELRSQGADCIGIVELKAGDIWALNIDLDIEHTPILEPPMIEPMHADVFQNTERVSDKVRRKIKSIARWRYRLVDY